MVLVIIAAAGSEEYWPKRRAYVAIVRLLASVSPALEAHTLSHLQASGNLVACSRGVPRQQCWPLLATGG